MSKKKIVKELDDNTPLPSLEEQLVYLKKFFEDRAAHSAKLKMWKQELLDEIARGKDADK